MRKLFVSLAVGPLLFAVPALAVTQAGVPTVPAIEGLSQGAIGDCAKVYLEPGQTCSVDAFGNVVISSMSTEDLSCETVVGAGCLINDVQRHVLGDIDPLQGLEELITAQ